jgi:ESS family glutamate:Na+ symporter
MPLDAMTTLGLAALVLLAGRALHALVPALERASIPQPISGGLVAALVLAGLAPLLGGPLLLAGGLAPPLLLCFFATIGLGADLGRLRAGGGPLLRFLVLVVVFLMLQNLTGVTLARALGEPAVLGLLAGSVTLVGGHGTGAAYAVLFEREFGFSGAMGLAMAAATLGLVLGGLIGGPVASRLMRHAGTQGAPVAAAASSAGEAGLDAAGALFALALVLVAAAIGAAVAPFGAALPIRLPDFLYALAAGVVIRNLVLPGLRVRAPEAGIGLIGGLALGVFLALAMAGIRLGELVGLAGPLLVVLAGQVMLTVAYAALVVFPAMGRNAEAAGMAAGFCGFAMGATATAIANMAAVSRRYGAMPVAFLVVPLTGAFFIDLANALVLSLALALPIFAP